MFMWILLAAHMIADFSLQSTAWAEKKIRKFRYLLGHALIYAFVIFIITILCIPIDISYLPIIIISVSHFIIDLIRVSIEKKNKSTALHLILFILDQILHILIIIVSVSGFGLNIMMRPWLNTLAVMVPLEKILRYGFLVIIILDPASVFVKKLSLYVSGEANTSEHKNDLPVGSVIGKLERILTIILVLCNEIGAIGFVLTAKSLARYKQLDNKDFAEKYLVGTLASTAIAIIAAILLK